jgi:diguanylate cyclase (GGDEF)-like protein
MQRNLNFFFDHRSPAYVVFGCLIIVSFVGTLDHLTGYELSFSIFYLVPVSIASWYAGKRSGIFVCIVSAATWLLVDYMSGRPYTNSAIPYWNAVMRLGFFTITAYLLASLKDYLTMEERLARVDGTTGVMNVLSFKETAQSVFRLAERNKRPLALGYIDVDNFKKVNDMLGHAEGDLVLHAVATTLRLAVRSSDLVARLAGDEFAVLLLETDYPGAKTAFAKLHEQLLRSARHANWPISFSIGVAVFRAAPESPDQAIKVADDLMYRAKRMGKNTITYEEFLATETTAGLEHPSIERVTT